MIEGDHKRHPNFTIELINQKLVTGSHFLLELVHRTSKRLSHTLTTQPPRRWYLLYFYDFVWIYA